MTVDWSVSIGNLLTMLGFVFGGISFVYAVRRDVSVLAQRLEPLEAAVTRIVELLTTVSRQDERLKVVERDLQRNDPRQKWRESSPN